jgi:hypothetical protein
MRTSDFPCSYIILLVLVALLIPAGLWAQNTRGSINGLVKDPTGAVIPGAAVTVIEQNTGTVFTTRSQNDGVFLTTNLLPGTYRLSS